MAGESPAFFVASLQRRPSSPAFAAGLVAGLTKERRGRAYAVIVVPSLVTGLLLTRPARAD